MNIQVNGNYSKIASGNRIQTAADDPAGLAISEKLNSQIKGDQQAIQNIESSQDLLKTADGSLNSILDDLGRVRELAVQAGNGTYSSDDRSIIQDEINSLFENIQNNVQNTEFNTKKLIDGSFTDQQLGVGANGQGTTMTLQDASLEALGLENFTVENGNFNLDDIDNAIAQVTESLSEIGASSNGLESNLNNTRVSEINQQSAQSTLADTDIAKAVMELNKQNILDKYQIMIQDKQTEQKEQQTLGLLI